MAAQELLRRDDIGVREVRIPVSAIDERFSYGNKEDLVSKS